MRRAIILACMALLPLSASAQTTGTPRTQSYLLSSEFQGGQSGGITSQDMRDLIVSNNANIFLIMNYGAACDGSTDDTTPLNNAIIAAQAAGGGTVLIPGAKCRINGVISPPYTGTSPPIMNGPVRITGAMWNESGSFGTSVTGGSVLDNLHFFFFFFFFQRRMLANAATGTLISAMTPWPNSNR